MKKINYIFRAITYSLLLCLMLGAAHFPSGAAIVPASEIYCPLQKMWVKRALPVAAGAFERNSPLAAICAAGQKKNEFYVELLDAAQITAGRFFAQDIESLFISYAAEGKQALAKVFDAGHEPDRQVTRASNMETSAAPARVKLIDAATPSVSRQRPLRKPDSCPANFAAASFYHSQNPSRDIIPRAPPVQG